MFEEVTKRPSALVLIIANLVPLFGVVVWGWSVFNIVLLYWMENVVLGLINILKMITCRPDLEEMDLAKLVPDEQREEVMGELGKLGQHGGSKMISRGHTATKFFMIPFFTVHYFMFCAGHGVFVFGLFGGDEFGKPGRLDELPDLLTGGFVLAAIGLVVSHLYSFVSNYLGRGEYKKTVVPVLMFKPYGRIVVLHIAIIFGGFAVMALGSSMGLLLIVVVGKILIDLKMHLAEHAKAAVPSGGSALLSNLRQGGN